MSEYAAILNLHTKMDVETAGRFISSLTKSLQTVLHGCLDFEKDIELGGYIYLRVDSSEKMDYVLSEKMQKNDVNSLTFFSNSFHAIPFGSLDQNKSSKSSSCNEYRDYSRASASHPHLHAPSQHTKQPQSKDTGHQEPRPNISVCSTADRYKNQTSNTRQLDSGFTRDTRHAGGINPSVPGTNFYNVSRSSDTKQSLTDFQTAFHSSRGSLQVSSPVLQPSLQHLPFSQAGRNDTRLAASSASSNRNENKERGGILPDPDDMEVVYIKTEDEDEVFSIPLSQPAGDVADDLTVGRKTPWLSVGMRQPFFFPYPRFARSQSWDRSFTQASFSHRSPIHSDEHETSATSDSFTCKMCGKCYRSRQGLIFHERVKHQNVFNVHCPVCGKGFQQTTHMYGHMATHTNVKNFQCQHCEAKYAHKTSLQQHLRHGSCKRQSGLGGGQGEDLSHQSHTLNSGQTVCDLNMYQSDRDRRQDQNLYATSETSNPDSVLDASEQLSQPVNLHMEANKVPSVNNENEESHTAAVEDTSLPDFDMT